MTSFKVFQLQELDQGRIAKVSLSRPKALNAMNPTFFQQLPLVFNRINSLENVRVVILISDARIFSAGLDLKQYGGKFAFDPTEQDIARHSKIMYQAIRSMQSSFLSIVECRVPVIVGVHNKCIGGAIDLTAMCDIRYCTEDAQFSIKQIDIGMAADLGTLQFFPNITGNQSTFRELAYTGRTMKAKEAKDIGYVSKIVPTKKDLDDELLLTAKAIAEKSPVGIYTLKQIMKREQYKKIQQSLEYMARVNSAMLLTKDMMEAVSANLQKKKPEFSKL